jgi:hypothetical protein
MSTSGAKAGQAFNFNFSFVDSADPTSFYTTQLQTSEVNIYQRNGASLSGPTAITTQPTVSGSIHTVSLTSGEMVGPDEVILEFSGTGFVSENISISLESSDADVVSISGDTVAADNLELQYDGTGLNGDSFPSYQGQLSNIAITGSAINQTYDTWSLVSGGVVAGTEVDTIARDGNYYQLNDTAGLLDARVDFDIGSDGVATGVTFYGYLNGGNDVVQIQAYEWGAASWRTVGEIVGSNGTSPQEYNFALFTSMVGTGADLGTVRIRFYNASLTSADLFIDQLYTSYSVVNRSIGYSNGSIWVDTSSANTGANVFIDGTADNPVNSYANANLLASSLDIHRYTFTAGDSITLTQGHGIDSFFGYNYQVDMNSQAPPTYVEGSEVTGICNGVSSHYIRDCRVGTTVTPLELRKGCVIVSSGVVNVKLLDQASAALDVEFLDCHGNTQGSMFPGGTIDFGLTAGTNHEVSFQRWGGPVTIVNLKAGDTVYAHGNGTFILDASCTGGSFRVAGMINLVDNSAGAVSVLEDGRITKSGIAAEVWSTDQTTYTTANTFGYNLDTPVSTVGGGGGGTDWTTTEKNQIRYRLGVDGTTAVPTATPDLSTFDAATDTVTTDTASRDASKADVSALATQASVNTIDSNVDAILVDTGTTLPATLSTIEGKVDTVDAVADLVKIDTSAILVDTGTTLPASLTTIEGKVDTVDAVADLVKVDTAAILNDTGTSGVAISTAQAQAIADEVLKRSVGNVEGASLDEHSLATVVLAILESQRSGANWTIYRTDGTTPQASKVLTLDASAQPVVRVQ